jgi:hypothetical protein
MVGAKHHAVSTDYADSFVYLCNWWMKILKILLLISIQRINLTPLSVSLSGPPNALPAVHRKPPTTGSVE